MRGFDVLDEVSRQLAGAAAEHLVWIRRNLRSAMDLTGRRPHQIYAVTGVGHATVTGFLGGRNSGLQQVMLVGLSMGYGLADLDRPVEEFAGLTGQATPLPSAAELPLLTASRARRVK